ncbi:MAG: 5-deoxy-glucuronate isomerase [Anaerolineae bacterium]|jgi:5-deoxy-glucuronate isomerase|nr:5-deoxy-glucuronate isomerase [Anaerolineae bacterium]
MQYTAANLLIKASDSGADGIFASVTAAQAGWQYLNMQARRLHPGAVYQDSTAAEEMVIVLLGGRGHVRTSAGDFEQIGQRATVFDGLPWAVYLSRHTRFSVEALSPVLEIAVCRVPAEADHPARLITPQDSQIEIRGGGNATRQINSIIPPGFGCQRLVCVEVYTPPGNWSSYPPHKHDVHRVDEQGRVLEADLEEIYFYSMDRPEGYAYQRVYTADGRIDALLMPRRHDLVLVPEGYHPVVSAHGYTTYYLNFLAGSAQSLANSDDPAYAWIKDTWTDKDPRVPVVQQRTP